MEIAGISTIGVVYIVLVVWALWDLLTSGRSGCMVIFWIIIIIVAPVFGSIMYFLGGRSSR